jgi:hypothetical protein
MDSVLSDNAASAGVLEHKTRAPSRARARFFFATSGFIRAPRSIRPLHEPVAEQWQPGSLADTLFTVKLTSSNWTGRTYDHII